jgi:hypothetical protein
MATDLSLQELVHGYRRKSKEVFGMFVKDLMLHRNANQMREICEAFRQITHRELSAVVVKVFKKEAPPYCAYSAYTQRRKCE